MDGKENMILPIYTFGQPVLRQEAEEIDKDYPELEQLIKNMYETLERSEGIGLAAPQVGLPIRLVVINLDVISDDLPEYKGYIKTFINPYIEEYDETEQDVMEEGCLSLPGIHEKVKRPTRIRVTYQDEQFQEHDEWVTGYLARVMQHEFDHLDGVVFTDHLQGLRRQLTKSKLQDIRKGNFSCNYKVKVKR
jgi:peptide deformylase